MTVDQNVNVSVYVNVNVNVNEITTVRFARQPHETITRLVFPVVAALIVVASFLLAVNGLGQRPPGFLPAEAANGLLARQAAGNGLALVRQAEDRSPLLAALITLVGRPFGFDALTARLAAAAAGALAALLTALWLRRVFGPAWGLSGGLLLVGSFWPLLFSRLALSPVAGQLALAALLWLLFEGFARRQGPRPARAIPWYAAAGVVAALGFMSDQTLRLMPVLLAVALLAGLVSRPAAPRPSRAPELALMAAVVLGLLGARPYFNQAAGAHANYLAFWRPTPGLAGAPVDSFTEFLSGYAQSGLSLVRPDSGVAGLHWPGAPLLSVWLVPWAALGLLVALRQIRQPAVVAGLIWGALLLVPAASVDPVHPGRLVAAMPLLLALPVAGMRAVYHRARNRPLRIAVAVLLAASIGGTAWSSWRAVDDWAGAAPTAAAFSASVRDGLAVIEQLPGNETILFSESGHEDLLRYLAPDDQAGRRIDFDGRWMLPLPASGDGYVIVPTATPLDPVFLPLLAAARVDELDGASIGPGYSLYRLDDRAREHLPLSIPTTGYSDGSGFLGHELEPRSDGKLAVLVAWRLAGDGQPRTMRVRLRPSDGSAGQQIVEVPLPGDLLSQPYDLVRLAVLDAPPDRSGAGAGMDTDTGWDLAVGLLDARGAPLTGGGVDTDGYLFLNRYQFFR